MVKKDILHQVTAHESSQEVACTQSRQEFTIHFEILTRTSRSVCIELINDEVYEADFVYQITLNRKKVLEGGRKNVCSLFDLEPDQEYFLEIHGMKEDGSQGYGSLTFRTKFESVRFNVQKFGAIGDGKNIDSINIQAAILACPPQGTVWIPKGTYLCTPLFLKSHITIELEEGATLLGHTKRELYPILPGYTTTTDEKDEYYLGTWEGNPLNQFAGLLTGIDVEDVAIIGKGILNGNAKSGDWWDNPKSKRGAWRPRTVFLKGCSQITLQGMTIGNSPSWTVHPYLSEQLLFLDLKIANPKDSPNTDGLDPESCQDVLIAGVEFSVGDDCIAIKSGKLYMGERLHRPTKKLSIRNCHMMHGHGAVVFGSEMSGGIEEVYVRQCLFEKTDRGIRVKTRRGRGKNGIIDQVHLEHITMKEVLTPFVMNMFYYCDPDGKSEFVWSKDVRPVDDTTPYLGRFIFKDIVCTDCEVAAGYFMGLPEQPIESILMQNVSMEFAKEANPGIPAMMSFAEPVCQKGIVASYVKDLQLNGVKILGHIGERLELNNVDINHDNETYTDEMITIQGKAE